MEEERYEITHTYYEEDWEADERRLTLTDDEVGHGFGDRKARPDFSSEKQTCLWKTKTFLNNYILPIGLLVFVIFGALVPQPGVAISHKATSYFCVIGIFLYSGLFLRTDDMKAAVKAYKSSIWGFFSILFFTSVIGAKLTGLLKFDPVSTIPHNGTSQGQEHALFGSSEFKTGFQLFFVVPCTISSGVLMVSNTSYGCQ